MHPDGSHLHQQHHRQIDDHISHRVHQSRNTPGGQLPHRQALSSVLKAGYLRILLAEGTKNPDAGKILPGSGGHRVQCSLNPLIHGHSDEHDAENDQTQHGNDTGKDQSRPKVDGKGHEHGTENHKGRPEQQTQGQVHAALHLVDIGSHPGDHGGGAQLVDLVIAQVEDMIHEHMAQTGGKAHRRHGRKILGAHSHAKTDDAQRYHDQAHFDHIARIPVSDALIHNLRHHQGHEQLEGCFQQLEYRAKNALFFVALQILQKRLHTITSIF